MLQSLRRLLDQGYDLQYVIVGDGPERDNLERMTVELGLAGRVLFTGQLPHEDVWSYFGACDIFVLPSWTEGFGIVYVEALSLGKPVVGCEGAGGPDDLRRFGECIELARPRDAGSLSAAIQRLLDDPERRRRLGENGRAVIRREQGATARHAEMLRDLLT